MDNTSEEYLSAYEYIIQGIYFISDGISNGTLLSDIGLWIANISGALSILSILLWILLMPKSDKRFSSGYKDNALAPGCSLPIFGIITFAIAYYISDNGFIRLIIQGFFEN